MFVLGRHGTNRHGLAEGLVNHVGATSGNGLTQFDRALHELNIDIIYANSSQAKDRVERANKTLQDRLVKELRLDSVDMMEKANAFLPTFVEQFNTKFAKEPANPTDLHRPLSCSAMPTTTSTGPRSRAFAQSCSGRR